MEMRPDTVPPPSLRSWLICPCMRPFSAYRKMLDRKVLPILSYSRASAIFCAIGCSCCDRKFFVKLGKPVLVRPYGMSRWSKTFAIDAAAHSSTSMPVSFLTEVNSFFTTFNMSCLRRSAASRSTRMPRLVISIHKGRTSDSRLNTCHRSSLVSSFLNNCQSSSVSLASASAYSPTKVAGSLYSSPLGSTPNSAAASLRAASDFICPV